MDIKTLMKKTLYDDLHIIMEIHRNRKNSEKILSNKIFDWGNGYCQTTITRASMGCDK